MSCERSIVAYDEVYDIKHPLEPIQSPRPMRSPFYHANARSARVFFEASGWERPQWYEANAPLAGGAARPGTREWEGRFWSPIVGAEHLATRERVGLYDMNSLTKVDRLRTGRAAAASVAHHRQYGRSVGSVTYTLMLDEAGGIKSD